MRKIGSYVIEEKPLAEGGMGAVFKGRHVQLDREAAIKTLLPKNAADARFRQRLLNEARAQALLPHPNIVTVYDFIEDNGELFIAMEYVDGETLARCLERHPGGRMALGEALPLFEQILEALESIHKSSMIHRDVKPSNVMVCGRTIKLTDFGIALLAGVPRVTVSAKVIGSPPYMSPEQLEAKRLDHRSDIYSAALVFYRMLSGLSPFDGLDLVAQIHARSAGPPDLRTLVPELTAGICEAVKIALAYDPDARFQSAAAFRDALREGMVGFLPVTAAHAEPVADESTLRMPVEQPVGESQWRNAVLAWSVVGGSVCVALYAATGEWNRPLLPNEPPARPVEAKMPAAPLPDLWPREPAPPAPKTEKPLPVTPEKTLPFPTETKSAEEPAVSEETRAANEERQRREIAVLREEINRGFMRVRAQLRMEEFDDALEALGRIAERVQRHPADFWQEAEEITRLRGVIGQARTRKEQDAMWESRLADVEADLRAGRWPEAERFAEDIAEDPRVPAPVALRARDLREQAKEGWRNAFRDTQLGPTTNKIRKPSSPPRKER